MARRRDEILESDPVYLENMGALRRNIMVGKVSKEMFPRVHPNMVQAALRRAGVTLVDARAMMKA